MNRNKRNEQSDQNGIHYTSEVGTSEAYMTVSKVTFNFLVIFNSGDYNFKLCILLEVNQQ